MFVVLYHILHLTIEVNIYLTIAHNFDNHDNEKWKAKSPSAVNRVE